jgi:hypothetical protein
MIKLSMNANIMDEQFFNSLRNYHLKVKSSQYLTSRNVVEGYTKSHLGMLNDFY